MMKRRTRVPKKVAVVLSGCGHLDGGEIRESVLALLHLDKAGVEICCVAPNVNQHRVSNHLTEEDVAETRNVLVESARIAREAIQDISSVNPDEFDAVIVPGGTGGMAMTVNNIGLKGKDMEIIPEVSAFLSAFAKAKKPAGFICIAPACAVKVYDMPVTVTAGPLADVANIFKELGADVQDCAGTDITVDEVNKVVCTPAYMDANARLADVDVGIGKLVEKILALI